MSRIGRLKYLGFALVLIGTLIPLARAAFRTLPLPYSYKSLEPHLNRQSLELHHDDHYRKHVRTLNTLLRTIERLEGSSLEEIMLYSHRWNKPLYNHAAQVWNHQFYFNCMTSVYHSPSRSLLERITKDFGSFDRFKTAFRKAGNSALGSGWAWLLYNSLTGKLIVTTTVGADNPMVQSENYWPILTMDVWEHAYYTDYRNRGEEYTKAFINSLVDWMFVEETLSRVEAEALIAAEKHEKARLEKKLARLEREKLEAAEAAERATIERVRIEAEAKVAREENTRLAIEAAAVEALARRDEIIEEEVQATRQEQVLLEEEVVTEGARPLHVETEGEVANEAQERSEAEVIAVATPPGVKEEDEVQATHPEEIAIGMELTSAAEENEDGIEPKGTWWCFLGRVYRLIFVKANATPQEDQVEAEIDINITQLESGIEADKPEEVTPPNIPSPQTREEEETKESTNPLVRYPRRLARFILGILRLILRLLHLILKIIFI